MLLGPMKTRLIGYGLLMAAWLVTNGVSAAENAAKPAPVDLFPDKVIAKGKGVEVKRSQLDEGFVAYKANAAARGQAVPEDKRETIEKKILDRLITVQILVKKATSGDRAKGKEKAQKFLADARKQAPSEEAFQRQLAAVGMSPQKFQAELVERATVEEVLEREITSKVTIPDAATRKFYDENPSKFEKPEMVRVAHILLATIDTETRKELPEAVARQKRETIDRLLTRARAGEDFAKLAKEFSEDKGTKDKGGELTFPRGMIGAVEFESAAFSLGVNQISEVITSKFGFHILKVLEKIPSKMLPYNEVSERIREALLQQEVQKQLPDYLAKLKKDAGVEILDESLKN